MPPDGLTDDEIAQQVRQIVSSGGHVQWRPHALENMQFRKISNDEVRECLTGGYYSQQPVIPNRSGPIEYEFAMQKIVDGRLIKVVAALVPETKVKVITAMEIDRSR
jgi:hypothetical protein